MSRRKTYDRFQTIDLDTLPGELREQMQTVERVARSESMRTRMIALVERVTKIALVPTTGLWALIVLWITHEPLRHGVKYMLGRMLVNYMELFASSIGWAISFAVGGVVLAILLAVIAASENNTSAAALPIAIGGLAIGALILSFPIFPVVLLALAFGARTWLRRTGRDLNQVRTHRASAEVLPLIEVDSRTPEYRSLLEHISMWHEWTEFLNRLIDKLECGVVPTNLVESAETALERLRADEAFLRGRIEYCTRLSQEGQLGAVPVRDQIGADLVQGLSARMDDMRRRIEKLREIDAKAIAALEVDGY